MRLSHPEELVTSTAAADVWRAVQDSLKEAMSQPSFETWIGPLQLESMDEADGRWTVTLIAESDFNRDQVTRRYKKQLQEAFADVLGSEPRLKFTVVEAAPLSDEENAAACDTVAAPRAWTPRATASSLNPRYTFEACVVGEHNRFCHAAALAVAETPAQSYNPFFIYGGVGLGKTHLMHAIGHFVHQHHPDLKVRYVTTEQFTNDLIASINARPNGMTAFRDRYRKIDVLILDDVQFLEGKQKTQEELFHTFNALHEAGKQIILSSDRSPKYLSFLEPRLRSRFEWGLMTDIQSPDFETRVAILQRKAEREGWDIPMDVLAYVAEMHPHNVRELEGALNKVAAYGMLTRTPMDLTATKKLLGTPTDTTRISLEQIVDVVAEYYHLRAGDLKSPSRAKDISHARQVAIYVVRTLTEASFPKIGELLGGRKHTTILYAYEKLRDELEQHPVLKQQVEEIKLRLKSGV